MGLFVITILEGFVPVSEGFVPISEGFVPVSEGFVPVSEGVVLAEGFVPIYEWLFLFCYYFKEVLVFVQFQKFTCKCSCVNDIYIFLRSCTSFFSYSQMFCSFF